MRAMTILGSPRRQGNTAKVLGWIESQFQADGHEVDRANILDYRVQGCGECMACKRGTIELCRISDDANELYRRMVAADLVLIAAQIFCWGFPAQIKGLLDRMFCLRDMAGEQPAVPWRAGKPIGVLLTGGGEEADNADLVIRGFEQLVDIDFQTYNIDPSKIEEKITKKTKAIMPVHLFGQCADMDPILKLAKTKQVYVIEDAAQALGSEYHPPNRPKGQRAGQMGDLGCFSFYPTKNLGVFGDAGMVVANDPLLAEKVRLLRVHGSQPKYYHKWIESIAVSIPCRMPSFL